MYMMWPGDIRLTISRGFLPRTICQVGHGWDGMATRAFLGISNFRTSTGDDHGFLEPVTTWFTMESLSSLTRRKVESQWFDYKKSAQGGSEQLLEGWTRREYEPPKWLK